MRLDGHHLKVTPILTVSETETGNEGRIDAWTLRFLGRFE